jgi:hypothetical protein
MVKPNSNEQVVPYEELQQLCLELTENLEIAYKFRLLYPPQEEDLGLVSRAYSILAKSRGGPKEEPLIDLS